MAFTIPPITPAQIRSTIFCMPLATKGVLIIIVLFYFLSWSPGFTAWAQLAPDKVFAGGAHRLNTYPFLHIGLFHTIINIAALVSLLEKFEETNGTITTVAMLLGPFSTFVGILYVLISYVLHIKSPIQGASGWCFLFLSASIFEASKTTPQIAIPATTTQIPTLAVPFILIIVTALLISHTSMIGHACAVAIGYGWGSGLLKFLAPPDKILRWIEDKGRLRSRLPSSYVSVDRGAYGRYGLDDLPTSSTPILSGTGAPGVRLGV